MCIVYTFCEQCRQIVYRTQNPCRVSSNIISPDALAFQILDAAWAGKTPRNPKCFMFNRLDRSEFLRQTQWFDCLTGTGLLLCKSCSAISERYLSTAATVAASSIFSTGRVVPVKRKHADERNAHWETIPCRQPNSERPRKKLATLAVHKKQTSPTDEVHVHHSSSSMTPFRRRACHPGAHHNRKCRNDLSIPALPASPPNHTHYEAAVKRHGQQCMAQSNQTDAAIPHIKRKLGTNTRTLPSFSSLLLSLGLTDQVYSGWVASSTPATPPSQQRAGIRTHSPHSGGINSSPTHDRSINGHHISFGSRLDANCTPRDLTFRL